MMTGQRRLTCAALVAALLIHGALAAWPVAAQPVSAPAETAEAQAAPAPVAPATQLQNLSGRGRQVAGPVMLEAGLLTVRSSHSGRSNFIVHLVGSDGRELDLLANTIGDSRSARAAQAPSRGAYLLNVTADGAWNIAVEQPQPHGAANLPQTFSGKGDDVTGFVRLPLGLVTARAAQTSGRSNFIVHVIAADGRQEDLLANEIGPSSSSKAFSGGGRVVLLSVQADGDWTVTLE
jgi:hypothetical protein